jgi:hypothetical protein
MMLPISTSLMAGITGTCHHAWPWFLLIKFIVVNSKMTDRLVINEIVTNAVI